jgi:hypothetical protein
MKIYLYNADSQLRAFVFFDVVMGLSVLLVEKKKMETK